MNQRIIASPQTVADHLVKHYGLSSEHAELLVGKHKLEVQAGADRLSLAYYPADRIAYWEGLQELDLPDEDEDADED